MTKKAKKAKAKAADEGDVVAAKEAEDKAQVYDSLQLAHKCILNSVRLKQPRVRVRRVFLENVPGVEGEGEGDVGKE